MNYLNLIVKGFLIGLANIIPGVSGGTFALILGIYERLIRALHNIGAKTVQRLLAVVMLKKAAISNAVLELRRIDFGFLALLGIGAAIAVVATSKLIIYLLNEQHDPTYGFFSGLILASIAIPAKLLKGFGWKELIALIAAVTLTIALSMSIGEKSLEKQKHKQSLEVKESSELVSNEAVVVNRRSVGKLAYLFLSGVFATSAMILPGISGAFVLLLFGSYFDILSAITNRDLFVLLIFAAGCGIGLLTFTRLLNYVFEHFYDLTISFLIGLMVGSLYGLWPFRNYEIVGSERIDLAHIIPKVNVNLLITSAAFLVGVFFILLFSRFEKRKQHNADRAHETFPVEEG